jgi:hypothetical protein
MNLEFGTSKLVRISVKWATLMAQLAAEGEALIGQPTPDHESI